MPNTILNAAQLVISREEIIEGTNSHAPHSQLSVELEQQVALEPHHHKADETDVSEPVSLLQPLT